MNMDLRGLLRDTEEIARECGLIILRNWNRQRDVRHKGLIDLVTDTDVAVQKQLEERLCVLLPEAKFVGEEGTDPSQWRSQLNADWAWVVDPVDGTTNFVHGIPFVSVSVALCQRGRPILGIVYAPLLQECFSAIANQGAFLNGNQVRVSETGGLVDALVATGFPYDIKPDLAGILARLERVLPATQGLRRLGSAALDLAYVACGRLDVFYEERLKPWDMAAGWLIVEQAGGMVTDFDGHEMFFEAPLLATNRILHEPVLKLLRSVAK